MVLTKELKHLRGLMRTMFRLQAVHEDNLTKSSRNYVEALLELITIFFDDIHVSPGPLWARAPQEGGLARMQSCLAE